MKKLPADDDKELLEFLKSNRPDVPPAAPDLEERIWQELDSEPALNLNRFCQHHPAKCKRLWLVTPAIAAGVMLVWASDPLRWRSNILPSAFSFGIRDDRTSINTIPNNNDEIVSIEIFLQNNWNGLVRTIPMQKNIKNISVERSQVTNAKSQNSSKKNLNQPAGR
ncbi:hypothetical protein ACE1CD_01110 [Aerosakkonema sp. BLCC-F183]|uniref:hypothetical protein n=1 Tax=Aerosakkonema sp. BLCC-F183 TaxID=3342834 RepID=UPI0035B87685